MPEFTNHITPIAALERQVKPTFKDRLRLYYSCALSPDGWLDFFRTEYGEVADKVMELNQGVEEVYAPSDNAKVFIKAFAPSAAPECVGELRLYMSAGSKLVALPIAISDDHLSFDWGENSYFYTPNPKTPRARAQADVFLRRLELIAVEFFTEHSGLMPRLDLAH